MDGTIGPEQWGWPRQVRTLLAGTGIVVSSTLLCLGERAEQVPEPSPLVLDPNIAPPQVLSSLPRIGPALAGAIVAARERKTFDSLDDLDARVRGIGPATREALRPFLRFDETTADSR